MSLVSGTSKIAFLAGVTGIANNQNTFKMMADKNVQIIMPDVYSHDHIHLAMKDAEILTIILKEHSAEALSIMESITNGKLSEAKKSAAAIGISEENFIKQGGGMLGLILFAIACALLLEHD